MNQTQSSKDHTVLVVRRSFETIILYSVLSCVAIVTVFPFLWVFFTSFKGPTDLVYSVLPSSFHNIQLWITTSGFGISYGRPFLPEHYYRGRWGCSFEHILQLSRGVSPGKDEIS